MRITYIGGTLLLLSALARSGRTVASSMPVCVGDCQASLAEHGLLTDNMKSTCATPKLQRAHFQCLINLCSPESYGRALEYSVSACCDSGVNLIPLHPIEIRQPLQHRRSQQPAAPEKKHIVDASTAFDQGFDLARNFAVALTCNTGQDGVVTVSLGSPVPSMSSASLAVNEDLFSVNGFITTILSNEPAATSVRKAILMEGSRGLGSEFTTNCESSNSGRRTTSWSTSTLTQSAPCNSNASPFDSTPTSTISSSRSQDMPASQTYPSPTCTSSSVSRLGDSGESTQRTPSTGAGSRTLEPSKSECTSASSWTDGGSNNWHSWTTNTPTTGCSDGVKASSMSTRHQTSTRQPWTLDHSPSGTSSLLGEELPCSSGLASSSGISSQSLAPATAPSRDGTTTTSCTASSRGSSSSFLTSDPTPCSASFRSGTSSDQLEGSSATNTLLSTSSNTFTTASTFDGTFAATPAAYTFASPSLPPAYIPPLADYGYGTPPPAYGFSSQGIGGGENRPSGNSYTTSSVAQQSSFGAGRQDVSPAAYSTSRETPARMAHAAPAHATNTGLDETKPQIASPAVEVTIVSSVSGEGLQTTVMTINQVEATSFAIPSVLALDSPVSNRQNSTGVEKGSVSSNEKPASNDEFDNTGGNGFETPMPAMLVGGSMTIDPSIYVLISTLCLAVGFSICIL